MYAIGAVRPLPAKMICGRHLIEINAAENKSCAMNRHSGLIGTSVITAPSGACAAEPVGATARTSNSVLSSCAMCHIRRSIPPMMGGMLRVSNNSFGKGSIP
ncbi:hypothetical protein TspCOW1_31730 [Thiohalobacter sp. COW1]|nr:hypothetical protein TspCOW1_31730 [Thiohalobacter sp. COW1]